MRSRMVWVAAAAVALVTVAVVALLWHDHNQSVLQRDPSYRYGQTVMYWLEGQPGRGLGPKSACDAAIASRTAPFPSYSRAKARTGCLDTWYQLNR